MDETSDALRKLLEAFADALAKRLGSGLSAVVVLGHGAGTLGDAAPAPRPAQLDLLVVGQELPPSRWDRHDLVYEALLAIESRRDAFAEESGWHPYFAVHLKTPEELVQSTPAFDAGFWVIADSDETFASWYRKAEDRRDMGLPRALGRGDRVYWDAAPDFGEGGAVPARYEELARAYLKQAEGRLLVTRVALEEKNFSHVVRAAQETVELSLKAMLAQVGIEPPDWHDVGRELREHAARFPDLDEGVVEELAAISSKLREHREPSVYGDRLDRLPPDRLFSEYDARVSRDWARQVFEIGLEVVHKLSL